VMRGGNDRWGQLLLHLTKGGGRQNGSAMLRLVMLCPAACAARAGIDCGLADMKPLPYFTDAGPVHQDRQPVSGNCSSCSPLWSLVTAVRLPCHHSTTASPAGIEGRRESAQVAFVTLLLLLAMDCRAAPAPSGSMPAAPLWLCPALCWLLHAAHRSAPRTAAARQEKEGQEGGIAGHPQRS
jgi:hypothetical protein